MNITTVSRSTRRFPAGTLLALTAVIGLAASTRICVKDGGILLLNGNRVAERREVAGWQVVALSMAETDAAYTRLLIATGIGALVVFAVMTLTAAWVRMVRGS